MGPTPGSLPSSSMRSWTTPSYTERLLPSCPYGCGTVVAARAGRPAPGYVPTPYLPHSSTPTRSSSARRRCPPGFPRPDISAPPRVGARFRRSDGSEREAGDLAAAEALGERAELVLLDRLRGGVGVPHRGQHQVGQRLGVLRVDRLGVDDQADQLAGPADGGLHQAAARAPLDPRLGQLGLGRGEVLLHLLRLLQQLLHVRLTTGHHWIAPAVYDNVCNATSERVR
ncbi:protein of unknown function [Streptantibioticus cattleyicolor NRRL 8057 = DSM 46488]|nr:protein of unknown function [Streptantibioticus cattleyicolor NRRL 8057 = DSM 46488]